MPDCAPVSAPFVGNAIKKRDGRSVFLQGASPEVRLLLLCSRTRVEPCTAQSIRVLLRETIDWRQLQRIAWQHGVTPLVYAALNSVASKAVPVSVLDDFRDQVRAATGRAAVQTKELLRLLALFEAAGVPAICFKGPVLAASVYGNVAFRVFSDLDLLVGKNQLPTICRILVEQGYVCDETRLAPGQMDAFRHLFDQHNFVSRRNSIVVEPHWEMQRKTFVPSLDTNELRRRATTMTLAGTMVRTLAPEDSLEFLCAHASHHHLWERLAWICDIAEFLRTNSEIDLNTLLSRSAAAGGKRSVLLGLCLAHELLDARLPQDIVQTIQTDPKTKILARQVLGWLFQEPPSKPSAFRLARFHIDTKERLRDKALYIYRVGMYPSFLEFDTFPLPKPLLFLYPPMLIVWRLMRYSSAFLKEALARLTSRTSTSKFRARD